MIEKELKQKVEDFLKRYFRVSNDEFEKAKENDESIANTTKILVDFATETTKELKKENADVQQSCENYYNEMRAYKTQVKELQQKIDSLQGYLETQNCYRECAETWEKNKELQEQIENLQIMLQAEREVRCNDEYLKKVTELEAYNEKLLESDIEKHNKIVELEAQIEKLKKQLEENQDLATVAYMQGASRKQKQLEAQIEKMKLCQNCKFEDNDFLSKPCCDCTRCLGEDIKRNGNTDKWEIQE